MKCNRGLRSSLGSEIGVNWNGILCAIYLNVCIFYTREWTFIRVFKLINKLRLCLFKLFFGILRLIVNNIYNLLKFVSSCTKLDSFKLLDIISIYLLVPYIIFFYITIIFRFKLTIGKPYRVIVASSLRLTLLRPRLTSWKHKNKPFPENVKRIVQG